jgi:predicted short-subunit dehydrogenase-like oxidoreductase (DUF2520 family)
VAAVSSRNSASATRLAGSLNSCKACRNNQEVVDEAELVFITSPDAAIAPVCESLSWHQGQWVVHCSAAEPIEALSAARTRGAQVGVFHPLQTLALGGTTGVSFDGVTFAVESEGSLLGLLLGMARALGGKAITLSAHDRILYHISAVMASNYMTTIASLAADLWAKFGFTRAEAMQSLLPLMRGTLDNLQLVGIPQCLSGPIARGDMDTLRKHLDALEESAPEVLGVYRILGLQTIPIALAKTGIDSTRAAEMAELLRGSEELK